MKNAAIVLAGGRGSRMKSDVKKQYLQIGGFPVLWYSLHAMQECPRIDEIVLVCGSGETEQCRRQYAQEYGFSKIMHVVEGGAERYDSVYAGLQVLEDCAYVLIHDGARPFLDGEILDRIFDALPSCQACVAGMPVKDTIKLAGEDGCVARTLPRERLWMIQTPQAFAYPLIRGAYDELARHPQADLKITDDAMVAETFAGVPVRLVEGSYRNIKITTPEDLILAEAFLRHP